ncbi:MAG: FAD-dependent oxidoreductase [Spirochaetota bacterium]|nr:MAG: FAD-dependent oxidoreductase [Spirochaetota bacterium]
MGRILKHPILTASKRRDITFTFNGKKLLAKEGEVISSALFAHGITVFGHHHDGSPQGIFCANGQCSHCMVIANGMAVKACMTEVIEGMLVKSLEGFPQIPHDDTPSKFSKVRTIKTPVLIVGGGPAGLSAAIEIAKFGVRGILVDDKNTLGGKLSLQTHNFFGSKGDCFAGTRGIDIGTLLTKELHSHGGELIEVWLSSSAIGVFNDRKVGIVKKGEYVLVKPEVLLVATGAREKSLAFAGSDLPGIYGAGAFQTLVNRDLIHPSEKLFICGGGNVGLISGYHALQAGIDVVGLVEALPECGGYRVHLDKLKRLGVPIYTSHTVLKADGLERIRSITICKIDKNFKPVQGTEKAFKVDTLLIAVGLSPLQEIYIKAKEYGMKVFTAGDAEVIAEASAAMFSGRIRGREIVRALGKTSFIPKEWSGLAETLRKGPGREEVKTPHILSGSVYPLIRCTQEIPCDPCRKVCPIQEIKMGAGDMRNVPSFEGESCLGCGQCVLSCPGLAIVLVDERYDQNRERARLTLPVEFTDEEIETGAEVATVGIEGEIVGKGRIIAYRNAPSQDRRRLMLLEVPFDERLDISGIKRKEAAEPEEASTLTGKEEVIICRCERVSKSEIVPLIRAGYRDVNQIKAATRAGMGACGGRTCTELILGLFREEGVDTSEVTLPVDRPPYTEITLGTFAGIKEK